MIKVERESIEPLYVTITEKESGDAVTPTSLALVKSRLRPGVSDWSAPVIDDGRSAYRLPGNLTPGLYTLYAKVTASPNAAVLEVGDVKVQ